MARKDARWGRLEDTEIKEWCGREESNLHGLSPQRPQRCASTNSATTALLDPEKSTDVSQRSCFKTRISEAVRPQYGYRLPPRQARTGPAALANPSARCKVCPRISKVPVDRRAHGHNHPRTKASSRARASSRMAGERRARALRRGGCRHG